jgi:hypothetical protein
MDPAYEMVGDLKMELTIDGRTRKTTFPKRDQFGPELVYFSNCVRNNEEPELGGLEGMADVRVINALLKSQETGGSIKLTALDVGKRPGRQQEIRRPPIGKPELVKAASPSK